MKKYILTGFIMMLVIASTVNAVTYNDKTQTNLEDFTHTVFAEECTATWCPNCPIGAEALDNIYQSGDYPFHYVSLVNDMNDIAKKRNRDYSFGIFKIFAFPTVYFDGGNSNFVGRGTTLQQTEDEYRALIEKEGQRTPTQPINMESSISWDGNAKLSVTITIKNEGNFLYFGKLRSYVTEIVSRWNDYSGNPYKFAFLDYAINRIVLLMPGKTTTIKSSFDGTANHGGQTFEDITSDNIKVITAISHWIPRYRTGYQSEERMQRYFAFVVDQTTAATPD